MLMPSSAPDHTVQVVSGNGYTLVLPVGRPELHHTIWVDHELQRHGVEDDDDGSVTWSDGEHMINLTPGMEELLDEIKI